MTGGATRAGSAPYRACGALWLWCIAEGSQSQNIRAELDPPVKTAIPWGPGGSWGESLLGARLAESVPPLSPRETVSPVAPGEDWDRSWVQDRVLPAALPCV